MGEAKPMGEVCLGGEKNDRMAFRSRADYQNHDVSWRQRGYSSLDGGTVVHFPRSWTSSGECRLNYLGCDGLIVPSARHDCKNLIIFTQNLDADCIIDEDESGEFQWSV